MKRMISCMVGAVLLAIVAAGCRPEGSDFVAPTVPAGATVPAEVTPGATPTGFGIRGEARVDSVEVNTLGASPVKIEIVARGYLQDGCTKITDISQKREGNTFTVTLGTFRPANIACIQIAVPFEQTVELEGGGLKAGAYTVLVGGATGHFTLNSDNAP
jgi:inhibitor of cysteine peptidase